MPASAVPFLVAYWTATVAVDAAESVARKVIVAPCGDAMASPREKLSVGSAVGLADAPPVTVSKPVAATASASAPRTIVLYMAAPRTICAVCCQYRQVRRLCYKRRGPVRKRASSGQPCADAL